MDSIVRFDVAESETEPLLGMALLYRYRLLVDNIEGGLVTIEMLPNTVEDGR
jgi:hypothetical protein